MGSETELFNVAVSLPKKLPPDAAKPSVSTQLELYGAFKQATRGDNNSARPAFYDVTGKPKWDAWNARRGESLCIAQKAYINTMAEFLKTSGLGETNEDAAEFIKKVAERGSTDIASDIVIVPMNGGGPSTPVKGQARGTRSSSPRVRLLQRPSGDLAGGKEVTNINQATSEALDELKISMDGHSERLTNLEEAQEETKRREAIVAGLAIAWPLVCVAAAHWMWGNGVSTRSRRRT